MRTEAALLATVLVVVASAGMAGATLADGAATQNQQSEPGARLAGVVGSHNATIAGEVDRRAFEAAFNRAATDTARAGVVHRQATVVEDRIERLREQKQDVVARHDNGTLPESAYRARMAALAARIAALSELANATSERAGQVPDAALRERGVNASRLDALRRNAANLSGPEVAAIAREVAGGPPPRAGPPGDRTRGPPEGQAAGPPGNGTAGPGDDRAATQGENRTAGQGSGADQTDGEAGRTDAGGGDDPETPDSAS